MSLKQKAILKVKKKKKTTNKLVPPPLLQRGLVLKIYQHFYIGLLREISIISEPFTK